MKKQFLIYLLAALILNFAATSCSDEDKVPTCPINATRFDNTNGLTLTYSGQPMDGKQAEFIPNPNDGSKAQIILSGKPVEIGGIQSPLAKNENAGLAIKTAGVIPGEATTTLNVSLKIDGDRVSFSGEEIRNGNKVKYAGIVTKSSMKLDLNVEMAANDFTGKTFKVVSAEDNLPVELTWKADAKINFLGDPNYELDNVLKLLLIFPIINIEGIDNAVTLGQALTMVVNDITFLPDGNIQANYKDKATDADWSKSPLNYATYSIVNANRIKLFINLAGILENNAAPRSKSSVDLPALIQQVSVEISRLMLEGVNIEYKYDENKNLSQFYLSEETLLPILKMLKPICEDETLRNTISDLIVGAMGQSDMTAIVKMIVPQLLKDLPKVIDTTTEIHIGINTHPSK